MSSEVQVEKLDPADWPGVIPEFAGDIVVLPREIDAAGRGIYDDSVVTFVKELRQEDVSADFQHGPDERSWAGEQSVAVVVVSVLLGVAGNAGWAAICRVLRRNHSNDRVRIRIVRRRKDGSFDYYKVDGPGDAAAKALEAIPPIEG